MMLHIPGKTDEGIVTEALTEFVDLYPTLVEAAGFPPLELCPEENSTQVVLCREGESLMPLIDNPNTSRWKTKAFSQFPRPVGIMGYTMRTDRLKSSKREMSIRSDVSSQGIDTLNGSNLSTLQNTSLLGRL